MIDRRGFLLSSGGFALLAPGLVHARETQAKVAYLRGPLIDGRQAQVLLVPANTLIFGRGTGSDIRLRAPRPAKAPPSYDPSTRISRRHFQIELGANAATIMDLGSSNKTKLAGEELLPKQARKLESGAQIEVAGVLALEVELLRAGKRPAALILGEAKGEFRVAMVAGSVGLRADPHQLLCAADSADLQLEAEASSLRLSSRKAAVELGDRVLAKGESQRIDRPTTLRLGELKLEFGLVDAWDALAPWVAPYDITHTFCGTPEY